jgi:microcystin-dependent protein
MASPNLIPINFGPGGDTFQYLVNLTNNLASLANKGLYTDGTPTNANANVVVVGTVSASYLQALGNNATISFFNDNGILTGQVATKVGNNSITISSSNTSNKLELFANGYATIADVKIATINDVNAQANSFANAINASANATLTAATNLINAAVPTGTILLWGGNVAPTGYYEMDGSAKSRTGDANLFAVIGTTYGAGNGSNTFNLPQTQGEFVRGWDHGRGVDSGRTLGSFQADALKSHTHTGTTVSGGDHTHTASMNAAGDHNHTVIDPGHSHTYSDPGHSHLILGGTNTSGQGTPNTGANGNTLNASTAPATVNITINSSTSHISLGNAGSHTHTVTLVSAGAHSHTFTTNGTGDVETRPRNIALMYIIKR